MDTRATPAALFYEDFQPPFEWIEDEKSNILLIELPGFKKEQIKVQIDNYGNLRATGERPLGGLRWQRFRSDHRMPENCNVADIRARFENERLHVTLPKLITSPDVMTPTRITTPPPETKPKPAEPSMQQPAPTEPVEPSMRQPQPAEPVEPSVQQPEPKSSPDHNAIIPKTPDVVAPPTDAPKDQVDEPKETPKVTEGRKDQEGENGGQAADAEKKKLAVEKSRVGDELAWPQGTLRQVLVNVAVAALVLVGLAVYAVYKLRKPTESSPMPA